MRGQELTQRDRRPLIEENAHSNRQKCRTGCVLKDVPSLDQSDTREPFDEFVQGGVLFEIFE